MANKVFGIDLGTTYSCISHMDEFGRPDVLSNFDNEATTPSVVLFDSADDYVVGKQAKRQARINPDDVASLVKRHMGDSEWQFTAHGKEWSAPAISALILKALATDAARASGETVSDVVITVPAYFGDEERKATKLAGEYAGLNVVDIINEPTAAAFAYGFAQDESAASENVLVYDLGGGTFDITIIQLAERRISVVATEGDHELGGADWDDQLAQYLSEKFLEQAPPGTEDPLDDSYGAQDLITSAEETKQSLSFRDSADVLVIHAGVRGNISVSRDQFEEVTQALLQRTIDLTRTALEAAKGKGVASVERVLLVGGSSKMPAVTRRLTEEFGFAPVLSDPDLSVAKGAALYGQKKELENVVLADLVAQGHLQEGQTLDEAPRVSLDKAVKDAASSYGLPSDSVANIVETKVENVCSRGFGLFVMRGNTEEKYAHFLTHRNDRLPIEVQDTFGTVSENQTEVQLQVFEQGGSEESERPDDNRVIVEGSITGIPTGYPQGSEIVVTFAMGTDGILNVSARHVAKDEPLSLRVETGAARSEADIAREQQALDSLNQKA
jgi:molecular chaperone DnaK